MVPQPSRTRNQRSRRPADADAAPPKRRDREVLDAAAKVFYKHGYADASVQLVAEELGILKGSLYHYIKTKEDLLFRLLAETHDDVDAILKDVEAVEGLSPLERLHLYVRRQVEYNIDQLERVSVYYQDVDRLSAERRREIFERRHVHERFVADLIKQAQAAGEADPAQEPRLLAPQHLRHDDLGLPLVPAGPLQARAGRRDVRRLRPARRRREARRLTSGR